MIPKSIRNFKENLNEKLKKIWKKIFLIKFEKNLNKL